MAQERTVVIVDSDEESRSKLSKLVRSLPGARVEADAAELLLGMKLARQTRPSVLIVELEPADDALRAVQRLADDFPGTSIIATSKDSGTDMVLRSVRAGAKEFLGRPLQEDEVRQALERLLRQIGAGKATGGKVISIFSNKGGTGTSTIAVNLAVALRRITGQDVALTDFDLQAGEVSLFLNLQPTKTIADIVGDKVKLDAATMNSALVKYGEGVFVLCEPERPEQTEGITGARIHEVLNHLSSAFPYVICDLSHSFNDVSLEVFDASNHILVVTLLNLPAIRSAHRCLDVFRQLNYLQDEGKVRLIVNRYLPNRDIDVEQLEETLHYPVFWKIPNDYPTVIDAVNSGLPIEELNPETDVASSFRRLAADLAGIEDAVLAENHSSAGLFGKILGRKR